MKKIILHSLIFAACFAFVTGCSKNVKTPASLKASSASLKTPTTQTTTETQNPNQQGHTCGGSSSAGNGSGY